MPKCFTDIVLPGHRIQAYPHTMCAHFPLPREHLWNTLLETTPTKQPLHLILCPPGDDGLQWVCRMVQTRCLWTNQLSSTRISCCRGFPHSESGRGHQTPSHCYLLDSTLMKGNSVDLLRVGVHKILWWVGIKGVFGGGGGGGGIVLIVDTLSRIYI